MASDYEKIRAENIRDYGEKTHHLAFLGRLYTDRTHFVFELLQNAEDKNASRVLFRLFEDRLEVQHNGKIFDDRDVRGICGVGEGTKADDLTKIGKFGIGFKAVYAYTSVPEVHSGDEHFRIEHYVRPCATPARSSRAGWTTLFVFGFDPAKVPQETASREIAARLRDLTARTLLFLRRITEIEYVLPDGARGIYLREEEIATTQRRLVTVIGESGGKEESERWLLFEGPVLVPESADLVSVEIGFKLESGGKDQPEGIVKIKGSPLYVFFPTERETNFGFLVQGPYRTTPARDNIPKDDDWNSILVNATAALIVESLQQIKELGLLTVAALNALPIRMEDFLKNSTFLNSMFLPIVAAVRDALKNSQLLPADDGTFISARNAKLARSAELRKLLDKNQLASLYSSNHETKWLTGDITEGRATADLRTYLMTELQVDELDSEGFARKISQSFLSGQTDEWFISFFRYLSGQEALWRKPRWAGDSNVGILRSRPILRLEDDRLTAPFQADGKANAYLPPPEATDLPVVKRRIVADEQAADFLKRLGLSEPDVFDDIVERVLPKYARSPAIEISPEDHAADIQKIFRALASDSEAGKAKVIKYAQEKPFLRAITLNGKISFKRPDEIYRDDSDLRLYFANSENTWFVAEQFSDAPPKDDAWQSLGVARLPRRIRFSGELPAGMRTTCTSDQIDNYRLDGFDNFIEIIQKVEAFDEQKKRSLILWGYMAERVREGKSFFTGSYTWFYYKKHSRSYDSYILTQLRASEWIPTQDQLLKKPIGLMVGELCGEFRDADELITLLGISPDDQTKEHKMHQYASELGVSLRDVDFMRSHPEEFREWALSLSRRPERPTFPDGQSSDPERSRKRFVEELSEAPEKEYEQLERSVRTSRGMVEPRPWLISCYTNSDRQMVCQLCHNEMPFKKRDGEYYFEMVEVLDRESIPIEQEAQFLALCPVCSAKYREFVKGDAIALAAIKQALLDADGPEIPISMGDQRLILRFVGRHFDRLRAILHARTGETA